MKAVHRTEGVFLTDSGILDERSEDVWAIKF